MKKIFCLIATLLLIAGCDDGDMGYKSFDFSNDPVPHPCEDNNTDPTTSTEIYYKINDTEGLILTLVKGALINTPTPAGSPREIILSGSNTLTYKNYVSKPSALCVASQIPAVTETWAGQGTLSVITVEDWTKDENGNNETLRGYIHQITMKNVTFRLEGSDETITINNSLFGSITYEYGFVFDFTQGGTAEPVVTKCPEGTLLYTRQGLEILSLNVIDFDTMFENVLGTKTITLPDATDGVNDAIVLFNQYKSDASDENACAQGSDVPSLPIQKWQLIKGTIEIITTSGTNGTFDHSIYLKNAIFGSTINTNDTFALDQVIQVGTNGYFFGTYKTN